MIIRRSIVLFAAGFATLVGHNVAMAGVKDLLFVVANPASLTAQETLRKTAFEAYGYTVTLIDDDSTQTAYTSATSGKSVAYIPSTVTAASVITKLKSTTIGVVNEHPDLADDFGFCASTYSTSSTSSVIVSSVVNYITYGNSGTITILASNQSLAYRTGSLASGVSTLANVSTSSGSSAAVLALDVSASLFGGGTAAGRRVLLPVGGSGFDYSQLNATGSAIFLQAIEWAAKPNPALGGLLYVATTTSTTDAQEVRRRLLLDTFGFTVTLIDDDDTQANYTSSMSTRKVVYVSTKVAATSLAAKVSAASIGVVNEHFDLVDDLKLASTYGTTNATTISINNNRHYITSLFSSGALTVFSTSQPVAYLSGTLAVGQRTLGNWSAGRGLAVVEIGGALYPSGNAAGRRAQLPWGGSSFDIASLNVNGKNLMRRAVEWAATTPGSPLLMVVVDQDASDSQEATRVSLLESFGYAVNTIGETATASDYSAAISGVNLTYVPEDVNPNNLGTKLSSVAVGVVSEEPQLNDELGLASDGAQTTGTSLTISTNGHYITSPFSIGSLTIFSSSQETAIVQGTIASDTKSLANWSSSPTLAVLEAGAKTYTGASVSSRRVLLPWGGGAFDIAALNSNGQTILQRSLQWASGLIGHWRLDELTGATAFDTSGKNNHGTLNNFSFNTGSYSPGKVNTALNFNGTNNFISIPNAKILQLTSAMSITGWIRSDTWGSGTDVDIILRKGEDNPNNWQLAIKDGRASMFLDDTDSNGIKGNTVLQNGVWFHVAGTWDGSQVRIYVNGALDITTPGSKTAPIGVDTRAAYIGGRSGTDLSDAIIDDVRLYNYALTAEEVLAIKGASQAKGVQIIEWLESP